MSSPTNSSRIDYFVNLENKTEWFPEAYLGEFNGGLGHIGYEWQTRRDPVNPSIEEFDNDCFAITAGRSDETTDPLMGRGDREERELRAQYLHAAVDGRNMKKGEEQSIHPEAEGRHGTTH